MDAQALITQVRTHRDASIAAIEPPLPALPDPLPKNVTKIPYEVLSKEELEITDYDPVELLAAIKEKKYTCEAVTRAFLRRAALAQGLVNCVTELLPERAITRAKYLDTLPPSSQGPLHGLPISIKEHHGMRDCSTNGSYVAWINNPPNPGPHSVGDVLWDSGCVFYARTTQPQAIMHLETSTTIYGTTTNPWNTDLTSGGSSGGESALVGLRGSILGVGGDIGGSIRCPAANCGVYGFKPTPGRLGKLGSRAAVIGQEGVMPTEGPLSTSLSGLTLFMKTYLDAEPWIKDDYLVPIPWRSISLPAPTQLKIAVLWDDGFVKVHPPITRALKEVVGKLKSVGIKIVDWIPEGHDECWNLTQALYYEDGGNYVKSLIASGNEPLLPLTDWLINNNSNVKYRTVEDVWDLKARRNAYRQRYCDLWLGTGKDDGMVVDAILSPTGPGPAPPLGQAKYWSYTSQWNLLEYPGAVFPVTKVDQEVDKIDEEWKSYKPRNKDDEFNWGLWSPEKYVDAPVGLQVVTRRFEDEKCLAVLGVIEGILRR